VGSVRFKLYIDVQGVNSADQILERFAVCPFWLQVTDSHLTDTDRFSLI